MGDLKKYLSIIESGLLIREVEQTLLDLYSMGKLNGTVHTCIGQELVGPVISSFLSENDYVLSNHRGHGHFVAKTGNLVGLFAEVMGRVGGVCGGYGGSQHLAEQGFLSNGIQGGMTPVAVGLGLGFSFQQESSICVCFIGDGTLGEGVLYESLNLASIWNCPVLFVVENNGYAQSTSIQQSFSGSLKARAEGFGTKYFSADYWDLEEFVETAALCVETVRNGEASVLEIQTYRLNPHSKGDDNRDSDEIARFRKKDPLNKALESNLSEIPSILESNKEKVTAALAEAERSALLTSVDNSPMIEVTLPEYVSVEESFDGRTNELIHATLENAFLENDSLIMIGEDIEFTTEFTPMPYGGAFKVSGDLSDRFHGRVRNTPISEAACIGVGTGLAITGMKPVVEIMFGDFLTLTLDQLLQHACKFPTMFGGKVKVPLVIRTPMGGRRGYGPTHSQSLERFFFGIPNLCVVALNHRISPKEIYDSVFRNQDTPTLVIENKILYTRQLNSFFSAGFKVEKTVEPFPTVKVYPDGIEAEITVFCYGGMLEEVEQALRLAFERFEIFGEIICPSKLAPISINPLLESVRKTGRLLTVEEGPQFAALGSEMIALVKENAVTLEKVGRMGNNSVIPCSLDAELALLPSAESICQKIKDLCND